MPDCMNEIWAKQTISKADYMLLLVLLLNRTFPRFWTNTDPRFFCLKPAVVSANAGSSDPSSPFLSMWLPIRFFHTECTYYHAYRTQRTRGWCGESCQVNYELKIYLPLLLRRSFTLELPRQRRLKRISLPWWQRGQTLWMIIVPAMGRRAPMCKNVQRRTRAHCALPMRRVQQSAMK